MASALAMSEQKHTPAHKSHQLAASQLHKSHRRSVQIRTIRKTFFVQFLHSPLHPSPSRQSIVIQRGLARIDSASEPLSRHGPRQEDTRTKKRMQCRQSGLLEICCTWIRRRKERESESGMKRESELPIKHLRAHVSKRNRSHKPLF
eukprot:TRINITY_DN10788_c0_g1_i1.p2 TRINITY_DN10788_c0_g1~~TRINITY_DN10788_c0_g1_i1.p2  ORF type:complete len:147 (-),score=14.30 TRINITY_DN10788_c0_g1_i1:618-1058(-)